MSTTRHDPQMLKGVLPMIALALLDDGGDAYGYDLVGRFRELGLADVQAGTIYPVLARLERDDHVDSYLAPSSSGPARKYYRITDVGRRELGKSRLRWTALVDIANSALGQKGSPS